MNFDISDGSLMLKLYVGLRLEVSHYIDEAL
jgi:hypothetical protein